MKYCDRIIKLRDGKLESMEIKKWEKQQTYYLLH